MDYLKQSGCVCTVVMNDDSKLLEMDVEGFDGVVLSPGPGTPEKSGFLMAFIEKFSGMIPILGVCLGHQALGIHFGLKLEKALKPMHGKVSSMYHETKELFQGISNPMEVCRYHSLVLTGEAENILPIAFTQEKEMMAFKHTELPIYGVQFHPEAILTKEGLKLVQNWLSQ